MLGKEEEEEEENYDLLFKIVLVGDSGVGKTGLHSQFISNTFDLNSNNTIGVEFGTKLVEVSMFKDNATIKAQVWDTSGQERYRAITGAYYRGAVAALLVYDITRRQSFQNIQIWLKEIHDYADENIVLILVGNKLDLAKELRAVSTEEATKYAQENNMLFMETSALASINSENAFKKVIEHVYEGLSKQNTQNTQSNSGIVTKLTDQLIDCNVNGLTNNQPTEREKDLEEKVRNLEIYKKKYEEQKQEMKHLREQVENLKIIKEQVEKNKEKDDMIMRMMQTIQTMQSQIVSGEKDNTSLQPAIITKGGSSQSEDNPENDICYDDPVDEMNP